MPVLCSGRETNCTSASSHTAPARHCLRLCVFTGQRWCGRAAADPGKVDPRNCHQSEAMTARCFGDWDPKEKTL